ncbi:MAG: 2-hydroxyacyl-CoA dehydratase family protein [candidate division WOR-3 bacterium]
MIRTAEFERLQRQRLQELSEARAAGKKVIGYWCQYVPAELIHASGAIPVRLLRASREAEERGEKYLRSDACSFCKVCLGGFETESLYRFVDGVVNVSTCDMMRRLGEAVSAFAGVPAFTLYLPRTSEPLSPRVGEFLRQLRLLADWLACFTGVRAESTRLADAITSYDRLRELLRKFDANRALPAPAVSQSDILDLTALAVTLDPDQATALLERLLSLLPTASAGMTVRPRLLLAGSIFLPADRWFLNVLEAGADVVGDVLCTGARWSAETQVGRGDSLESLAWFYYSRPACACRRPNDELYQFARQLIAERGVQGIVVKTLLYCDPWSFEIRRLRQKLRIPVLAVDSDYAGENQEQVRTRIEAFLEAL